jgi:two-component system, LytTR family, response regulator
VPHAIPDLTLNGKRAIKADDLGRRYAYRSGMSSSNRPARNTPIRKWNAFYIWLCIFLALSLVYAFVFTFTQTLVIPRDIVLWSFCNALPHIAFAIPLVDRLAPQLQMQRVGVAVGVAGIAVFVYAFAAYCSAIFLLAATGSARTEGIFVRFFSGPALPWQMFQGTAYGCVAIGFGLWLDARKRLLELASEQSQEPKKPQRWLVKTPDGIVPIDPADILRIEAAGEYSRLVLLGQSMLSRISMTECEERLASYPFIRAHRSHIVHNDAIVRAEPAGNGRLQLILSNGDQVITSRDGARLVRDKAI